MEKPRGRREMKIMRRRKDRTRQAERKKWGRMGAGGQMEKKERRDRATKGKRRREGRLGGKAAPEPSKRPP